LAAIGFSLTSLFAAVVGSFGNSVDGIAGGSAFRNTGTNACVTGVAAVVGSFGNFGVGPLADARGSVGASGSGAGFGALRS
jgi:hypothetical protein